MNKYMIISYLPYPVVVKVNFPPEDSLLIHPYAVLDDLDVENVIDPGLEGLKIIKKSESSSYSTEISTVATSSESLESTFISERENSNKRKRNSD